MMRAMHNLRRLSSLLALLAIGSFVAITPCGCDDPDDPGEAVEDAVDETGDAIEDIGDDIG